MNRLSLLTGETCPPLSAYPDHGPLPLYPHRLDPLMVSLDAELEAATTEEDAIRLKKQIKDRQDALLPLYLQVRLPHSTCRLESQA